MPSLWSHKAVNNTFTKYNHCSLRRSNENGKNTGCAKTYRQMQHWEWIDSKIRVYNREKINAKKGA